MSRRAHCRRVATEQPGRLAEASLAQMADFLGAQEGESAVDPKGAIVLRWLLTVYLPQHPVREIGVPARRDLWAFAEALDLLQGRSAAVADLLAQRFKALQVALHDGNWSGAKWLELTPPRDEPTALRGEEAEELIRGIQAGELKLDELTAKLRKPGLGSGRGEGDSHVAPPEVPLSRVAQTPPACGESGEGVAAPSAASGGQHHGAGAGDALPPLELGAALAETVAPRAGAVGAEAALPESLPLSEVSESMTAWRRRSPAESGRPMWRVDLAIKLARFAQLHPGSLGRLAGQALPFERSGAKARVQDLRPLPLPPLEEAWTYMSVLGLNHMHCRVARESFRLGATLTLAQETATRHIRSQAAKVAQQPFETAAVVSLSDAVATSSVDYSGEPMMRAPPCAYAELAPGLPKREHAATLSVIDFVDDEVARWLADPTLALKAEADFPDPLPKARANVGSQFEWEALAMHLVDLGIFTVLPAEELVRVRGEPLLNGLFAVEKTGAPGPGASRVARLILNMVPGNAPIEPLIGGAAMLAGSTVWVSLHVPGGKLLLWSGDDQKGAFFAWRVPRARHRRAAVGRPLAGSLFGRQGPEVYLASAVIAMGWSLAVPLHRRIHRRLRRLPPPLGAGLPPQAEWRKDAPRPAVAATEEGDPAWWQVYIDDFDAPEIVEEVRAWRLVGSLAEMRVRARASYDRAGVAYPAEKAHCRQLRVERMGADVDGESGRLAAPMAKSLEAIALRLASFRLEAVPWRPAMTILGRFARLFEFRRPLFSVLNEVWRLSSLRGSARLSSAMVEELLTAMLVMPMAATSLRAKIEGTATVSDAPEFGGGARASAGPRAEAEASLDGAPTLDEQMHLGARLLQLLAEPSEPWTVANSFILRAAVLRAPKTDAKARRVARLRWPGAIDWGDVARVAAAVVNELRDAYCDEVDLCAAAAGSPCQDPARQNASGAGLRGAKSGLFCEVPRLLELLKAAFGHKPEWFVENVATMTADNRAEISRALGVEPFLVRSSVLVPCRRPRLYWMS
ncbi:unnamed protein product [Prorocentrum cordatum]|uniref:Uncharacterized protein n=1 Tax=Prorocentrum cordatum TaxID=2364126 RepID=A0ABN9SDC7_9DINO|nr:unnamed protein product [Polarella glacialis]